MDQPGHDTIDLGKWNSQRDSIRKKAAGSALSKLNSISPSVLSVVFGLVKGNSVQSNRSADFFIPRVSLKRPVAGSRATSGVSICSVWTWASV